MSVNSILTAEQMRRLETDVIRSGRASGERLMERAGEAIAREIDARWGARSSSQVDEMNADVATDVLVLCGPGNNGGDGFVVARLLANRNWSVRVALFGNEDGLPKDAAANLSKWRQIGDVHPIATHDHLPAEWISQNGTIVVDALFGTGLCRPLATGLHSLLTQAADCSPLAMIAVDMPSGVCSDSGRLLNPVPQFDLTVTFHTAKPGHFLDEGSNRCGDVVVADIGIDERTTPAALLTSPAALDLTATLEKRASQHKYDHGHALVFSGPPGRGGAARLAARGALRVGSGLVSIACETAAIAEHAAQLNAIMIKGICGSGDVERLLADARFNALCAGPALGTDPSSRRVVVDLLRTGRPLVLDADALSLWEDAPCSLISRLHPNVVLTPHMGEFSRLFPDLSRRLVATPEQWPAFSRLDAVQEAAARAGCTVVLKGSATLVATPGEVSWLNAATGRDSVPWLATAGSGDVLAGMIAGLLGRGLRPHHAAASAVCLHTEAARQFGPGLIAEDIPEALPQLFASLKVNQARADRPIGN